MDDHEYSDLSMSERLAAEREMRKRDRDEANTGGRMRKDLLYGKKSVVCSSFNDFMVLILVESEDEDDEPARRRRRRLEGAAEGGEDEEVNVLFFSFCFSCTTYRIVF